MKIILQFIHNRNYSNDDDDGRDGGGGGGFDDDADDTDDKDNNTSCHYDHNHYNINHHYDKVHQYKNNDAANNDTTNEELLLLAVLSFINQIMRIIIFDYPHLCLYFHIYFDDKYLYHLNAILQRHNGSSDDIIHDDNIDDEDGDLTSKIEISTRINNYDSNHYNITNSNVKYHNNFQSIHNHTMSTETTINSNYASNVTVRTTTATTRTSIVMMINKQAIICISLLCYNHKLRDIILKLDYVKLISNLLQRYYHQYYREQLINNHSEYHTTTTTTIVNNSIPILNTKAPPPTNTNTTTATTYPTNTTTTTATTTAITIIMMSCIIEALGNMVYNQDIFQIILEYDVIHILFNILYHHHQHQEIEHVNNKHVINNNPKNTYHHHHSFRLLAVRILQKWLHYDNRFIIITIGGGINALIAFSDSLVTGYDNNNNHHEVDYVNHDNNDDDDSDDVKCVLVDMIKQVMGKKQKQLNREMDNLVSASKESSSVSSYVPLSSASRLVSHHPSSSVSSSSLSPYQHSQLTFIKQDDDHMISEKYDDDNIDWLQDLSFVRTRAL
jgi:hypothetical protein